MSEGEMTRHDHVLAGLVFSLQAAAMQQLGKIQNPMTGEIEVDLDQARSTIDVLEMLKVKCRTDTPEDLLRLLDQAVMDLQLNYMDEMKKAAGAGDEAQGEDGADETAERGETDETADPEHAQDDDTKDEAAE